MQHYFTNNTKLKSNEKIIKFKLNNKEYKFMTDNGVFSKDNIDIGTTVLLSSLNFENISGNVLDMGCGYGTIGIVIAKNCDAKIDMVDINERAIKLAKENIELNKVCNAYVFLSDAYEKINKKYDYIISNPPIRIGKNNLYNILITAKNYLRENGELIIVINKHQGAKTLIKDMSKYYLVSIIEKKHDFFVISLKNN